MHARVDEFARLATLEMGKRIDEARGEVQFSADILAYYAKNAERFLAPVKLNPNLGKAHMESSPIGVIFGVEPWNFPFYQLARVAGPHLMAGNVLVKHAGIVPQCAIAFEKLWAEAGAPAGLYTNLLITHAQSNRIVDDPRIKGVALTGSVAAGKSIAARAGANVKVSSMELGGSDAFIVLEDADLEHTVKWAVWGGCTTPARRVVRPSDSSSSKNSPTSSWRSSARRSPRSSPAIRWTRRRTLGPLSTESALVAAPQTGRHRGRQGSEGAPRRQAHRSAGIVHGADDPDGRQAEGNPAFREEFFGPVALFLPGQE
jgi:succinate-semialdehyde dehydrogenase/glutarate-semialdehyde dehydrogenase